MSEAHFHGVFPYLVSPVHENGEVNANVLAPLPPEGVEEVRRAIVAIGALYTAFDSGQKAPSLLLNRFLT